MAIRTFINNAVDTKDAWTVTIALTWAAADTITMTINSKTLVVTIGTLVTTAQVATTLKEAWNGTTFTDTTASCIPQGGGASIPEFAELAATVSSSVVTLLSATAGVPHTLTSGEVGATAGNGTATVAHSVTATGQYYGDNVLNWLEGATPVDGDDVVIDGPYKWKYGMAFSAIQPASFTLGLRCTAATQVGLPWTNANGYNEYRTPELAIGPVLLAVRGPVGLVKINLGADTCAASVYDSGTSLDTGYQTVQLRGTHATTNSTLVYGGKVSIAARGETAVSTTIRQTGGTLIVGNNVSWTTISGSLTIMAD